MGVTLRQLNDVISWKEVHTDGAVHSVECRATQGAEFPVCRVIRNILALIPWDARIETAVALRSAELRQQGHFEEFVPIVGLQRLGAIGHTEVAGHSPVV